MLLIEREFEVKRGHEHLLAHFRDAVARALGPHEVPIRFAVTRTDTSKSHCELGVLTPAPAGVTGESESIFAFRRRKYENRSAFTAVMLVPTGIGAEIGGHGGDACPVAKLPASVCDKLIPHPNVVNASDINEMPPNSLYVEGSVISDFLMGMCGLVPVRANRVLLLIDKHKERQIFSATINAVSAARATLGLECPAVVEIDPPLVMRARYSTSGMAVGRVEGLERVCEVLDEYEGRYDAVGLASVIDVPSEYHTEYFRQGGRMVNPWGGVEAMLTHAITKLYGVPAAHSPMFESTAIANLDVGVVDPRMSAEAVSACFLHCILKGLHKSPQVTRDRKLFQDSGVLTAENVSCLVIPDGCVGLPTLAAIEQGIPVIAVRENCNRMRSDLTALPFAPGKLFIVDNYLEAAGVMMALKAGVAVSSVRRPLADTVVSLEKSEDTEQADTSDSDEVEVPEISQS